MNSTDHTATTINKVKKGEFVRFKVDGPVWVRSDYDKSSRKFCLYKFDDVNQFMEAKPTRACFVGFTF